MNDLMIVQITLYLTVSFVSLFGNVGTIIILRKYFVDKGLDKTTINLIVESCVCDNNCPLLLCEIDEERNSID